MVKSVEDFMFSLDYCIIEYGDKLPVDYLERHGLNSIHIIPIIIGNAIEGKKENGLLRLRDVRNYLIDCLQYYKRTYANDNGFESQEEIEFVLSDLISDLEPKNFIKIAQIITPQEIINIKNISRKKELPEDIEREIASFIGKSVLGGHIKRRRTKRTKRNKKKYLKNPILKRSIRRKRL